MSHRGPNGTSVQCANTRGRTPETARGHPLSTQTGDPIDYLDPFLPRFSVMMRRPISKTCVKELVFHAPPHVRALGLELFGAHDLTGKAVLIHTGWDKHWRTDQYFTEHPFLTRHAAEYLHAAGVRLVGMDSYNINDTTDGFRPVHSILLGADIPIVEHLCHLEELPDSGFAFYAISVKIKGCGTFSVRAFDVYTPGQYNLQKARKSCSLTIWTPIAPKRNVVV